jgi:hypothetical protein
MSESGCTCLISPAIIDGTSTVLGRLQMARRHVSVPVLVDGRPAAVLKVYASSIDGLSQSQRDLATSVAADVAGGMGLARQLSIQAHTLDDRESAMDTRRVIDLALGALMERTEQLRFQLTNSSWRSPRAVCRAGAT